MIPESEITDQMADEIVGPKKQTNYRDLAFVTFAWSFAIALFFNIIAYDENPWPQKLSWAARWQPLKQATTEIRYEADFVFTGPDFEVIRLHEGQTWHITQVKSGVTVICTEFKEK